MILSAFKTYVKNDFKRTDKDTELVQAYNDMIMYVAAQMPHGDNKFQSYINTTVGIEDYPIPSNLMHIIHPIRILYGSATNDSGYGMEYLTKEQYDFREPNPNRTSPTKGMPSAYTIWSRSILLTPIPDLATYILEIDWAKHPCVQALDADLPCVGKEYDEIFKWGTLERLYAGLGQYDDAQYWGSKYHDQEGNPIGMLRMLLDAERDREGIWIGQIRNNCL